MYLEIPQTSPFDLCRSGISSEPLNIKIAHNDILCIAAVGWMFYLYDVEEEQTGQIKATLQPPLL